MTILLGNGSGGFSPAADSPVAAGFWSVFVAAGDLNLDGKPDLAVANSFSDDVTILPGRERELPSAGGLAPRRG